MLTATGGHAGNDHAHAVIRRWTAPRDSTVGIVGSLGHNNTEGDGVRGRLVSSREGLLATWHVRNKSAGTKIDRVNVKAGTNEGCDAIGRGEAIAAHAVVLLTRAE